MTDQPDTSTPPSNDQPQPVDQPPPPADTRPTADVAPAPQTADVTQTQASEARDITRETEAALAKTSFAQRIDVLPRMPHVGDSVLVYSPQEWYGARPGIVVGDYGDLSTPGVSINIFFDGSRDELALQQARANPHGNTRTNIHVVRSTHEAAMLGLHTWALLR